MGWLKKLAKIDILLPGGKGARAVEKAWQDLTGKTQQIEIARQNVAIQEEAMRQSTQSQLAAANAAARAGADAQAQASARAAAERIVADSASAPVASTEVVAGGQPTTQAATRRRRAQFGRSGSTSSISI